LGGTGKLNDHHAGGGGGGESSPRPRLRVPRRSLNILTRTASGSKGAYKGKRKGGMGLLDPDSHDYEPDESEVWRSHQARRHSLDRGRWWTTHKQRSFKRWIMTLSIGLLTGCIAAVVNGMTVMLTSLKFNTVYHMIDSGGGPTFPSFLALAAFSLCYVLVANFMVILEPLAAGSGIPEIKCFLNGIDIPRCVRMKTMLTKVLGVTFTVAGGLPAGKEGPMVHTGAVVAAGVSQGKSTVLGCDTSFTKMQDFRNDREKRDFVACGAAAGVAAAFGAPIGGVLFSLEEGASFWSTRLTWRAFFCAMITVFTLHVIKSSGNSWGQQDLQRMFSFGEFNELDTGRGNYSVWELWLFILLGCMGGLIGAAFNHFNRLLTIFRMKHVTTTHRRLMEVLAVTLLVATTAFVVPLLWGKCTPKPVDMENWTEQEKTLVDELVPFNCNPHTEYNEVASLFFTNADTAIRQLFHFRESGQRDTITFSSGALLTFFVPYIMLACLTYGIAVPSGLFVPSLLSGAAFGRLCGHLLHKLDGANGTFADSGTYALIGAAAVLGGMARMTISLTVILLEATGDMQYVLPLMLTLMAARWVGNVFNEGLYDIHIHLRSLPFLEDELPHLAVKNDMTASQVMNRKVKCMRPVERAGFVFDVLNSTEHDCFPVVHVQGDSDGVLVGTVLRKALCVVIQRGAFGRPDADPRSPCRVSPLVSWDALETIYPRYPDIKDLQISQDERQCWIDLRPYVNTAPYVINESSSLSRTYRLFRTLGLRHLCVVNHHNQVVGIITRKDLVSQHLQDSLLVPRRRVWQRQLAIQTPRGGAADSPNSPAIQWIHREEEEEEIEREGELLQT
jgi:chloride channel 7